MRTLSQRYFCKKLQQHAAPTEAVKYAALAKALAVLIILFATFVFLGSSSSSFAHGGGSADYLAEVTSITPDNLPISVEVRDRDDRLRISNTGDKELLVWGYNKGDQYARIGPKGVFVNKNSEAYFNNEDRFGEAIAPQGTDHSKVRWVKIKTEGDLPVFEYHDHRIHWMMRSLPPNINSSSAKVQRVLDWDVPLSYGETDVLVKGKLDYVGGKNWWSLDSQFMMMVIFIAAILVVFAVVRTVLTRKNPSEKRAG